MTPRLDCARISRRAGCRSSCVTAARVFPPEMLEAFNTLVKEDSEIPSAGAFSTASDLFRFAEALRRGGELEGARILSPAIIRLATTNQTGMRRNSLWDFALEMRVGNNFRPFSG